MEVLHHWTKGVESFVVEHETIESDATAAAANLSREGLKKAFTDFVGVKAVGILGSVVLVAGQGGRDCKGVRSEWEWGGGGSPCVWGVAGCQLGFARGPLDGGGDKPVANSQQADLSCGTWIGNRWRDLIVSFSFVFHKYLLQNYCGFKSVLNVIQWWTSLKEETEQGFK